MCNRRKAMKENEDGGKTDTNGGGIRGGGECLEGNRVTWKMGGAAQKKRRRLRRQQGDQKAGCGRREGGREGERSARREKNGVGRASMTSLDGWLPSP